MGKKYSKLNEISSIFVVLNKQKRPEFLQTFLWRKRESNPPAVNDKSPSGKPASPDLIPALTTWSAGFFSRGPRKYLSLLINQVRKYAQLANKECGFFRSSIQR